MRLATIEILDRESAPRSVAAATERGWLPLAAACRDSGRDPGGWFDSMLAATQARKVCRDWIPNRRMEKFALTPDWDNRWRTGGSVDQIVAEAHLDPESLQEGIQRYAQR